MPEVNRLNDADLISENRNAAARQQAERAEKRTREKLFGRRGDPILRCNFVSGQYLLQKRRVSRAAVMVPSANNPFLDAHFVAGEGWKVVSPSVDVQLTSQAAFTHEVKELIRQYNDIYVEFDLTMKDIVDVSDGVGGHAAPAAGLYIHDGEWNGSWAEIFRGCYPFGTGDLVANVNDPIPGRRVMLSGETTAYAPQSVDFPERFKLFVAYRLSDGELTTGLVGAKEPLLKITADRTPMEAFEALVKAGRNKRSTGSAPSGGGTVGSGGTCTTIMHSLKIFGKNRIPDFVSKDRAPFVQPMPLTPRAISNFKDGIYSIGGVAKTRAEMWTTDASWSGHSDDRFVPGVGYRQNTAGTDGIISTPELFAVASPADGTTFVMDFVRESSGPTAQSRCLFQLSDLPNYAEIWELFLYTTSTVRFESMDGGNGAESQVTSPPLFTPERIAFSFTGNSMSMSVDGRAAEVVTNPAIFDNLSATMFGLYLETYNGAASMVVENFAMYDYVTPARLPELSAR